MVGALAILIGHALHALPLSALSPVLLTALGLCVAALSGVYVVVVLALRRPRPEEPTRTDQRPHHPVRAAR